MATEVLDRRVLILNKDFTAIGTCSVRRSLILLFSRKAKVVNQEEKIENDEIWMGFQSYSWDEWSKIPLKENEDCIKSSHLKFKIPEVIHLTDYEKFRHRRKNLKLTAKNIYKRDDWTCVYCNKKYPKTYLSVDHLVPKSKGGSNSWTNLVTACRPCNRKKGSKNLSECGMKLHKTPHEPVWTSIKPDQYPNLWDLFINE